MGHINRSQPNYHANNLKFRSPDQRTAQNYWQQMSSSNLCSPYAGFERMSLPMPHSISRKILEPLVSGSHDVHNFIRKSFPDFESLDAHIAYYASQINGQSVSDSNINKQLFSYLQSGWTMPLAYDVLITEQGAKLLEVQTGWGVYGELLGAVVAARNNPAKAYWGVLDPRSAFNNLKQISKGKDVTVFDVEALTSGSVADRIYMARNLGHKDAWPVALEDIDIDLEGIFFHERKLTNEGAVFTERKIRPEAVLCRATSCELEDLVQTLIKEGRPSKAELLLDFFRNDSYTWITHPAWYELINKHTLPKLADYAETEQLVCNQHLVAWYSSGQEVASGRYADKLVNGNSGIGFRIIEVASTNFIAPTKLTLTHVTSGQSYRLESQQSFSMHGEYSIQYQVPNELSPELHNDRLVLLAPNQVHVVPEGRVYQDLLIPEKIPVELPFELAPGSNKHFGSLELRFFALPSNTGQLSGMFAYRLAPRYDADNTKICRTNLAPAMQAYRGLIERAGLNNDLYNLELRSPFGFGAVLIGD